jgi:hypothetical protein
LTISGEFVRIELIEPAKAMLPEITSKWRAVALMDQTRRQPYNKPAISYEEQVENYYSKAEGVKKTHF